MKGIIANVNNIHRILGEYSQNNVHLLLSYAEKNTDIADPWFTGDFDKTYDDIVEGCNAFLNKII